MRATHDQIRHILTRLALAMVFVIFGIWEIIQPSYWIAFVPPALSGIASASFLVTLHGVLLLTVGAAILLGAYLRIASALAVLIMLEVMAGLWLESGFTDLMVRDLALLILAVALYFDDRRWLTITKNG